MGLFYPRLLKQEPNSPKAQKPPTQGRELTQLNEVQVRKVRQHLSFHNPIVKIATNVS